MASFGRAQKFAGNRKQEIQLQKELEAIRNKAILEHLAKQHGMTTSQTTEPASISQAKGTTATHTPIPSSQSKSIADRQHPKRKKMVQISQPVKQQCNTQLSVSSRAIEIPHQHKRQHQSPAVVRQQQQTLPKELSPHKVVCDTSQNVKFAITSTLKTSAPVKYNKRDQFLAQKQCNETRDIVTHSQDDKVKVHSSRKTMSSTDPVPPLAESAFYQDNIVLHSTTGRNVGEHSISLTDSLRSSGTDISSGMTTHSGDQVVLEGKHGTHQQIISDTEGHEITTAASSHPQSGPLKLNIDLRLPSQDDLLSQLSHQSVDFGNEDAASIVDSIGDQSSLQSTSSSSVLTRITVAESDHSELEQSQPSELIGSENQSLGSKSTLASFSSGTLGEHETAAHSGTDLLGSHEHAQGQSKSLTSIQSTSTLSSPPCGRLQLPTVDLSGFPSQDSPSETSSFQLGLDKGVNPSVSQLDVHSEVVLEETERVNVVSSPIAQSAPAIIATNYEHDYQSQHQLETVLESDLDTPNSDDRDSTIKAPSSTITNDASSTPLSDGISSIGLPPFSLPSQTQSFGTPSSQKSSLSQPYSTPSLASQHSTGDIEASLQLELVPDAKYGTTSENYISTSSWLMSVNANIQEHTAEGVQEIVKTDIEYETDHKSVDSSLDAPPSEDIAIQEHVTNKQSSNMTPLRADLNSVSGSLSGMVDADLASREVDRVRESSLDEQHLQQHEEDEVFERCETCSDKDSNIQDNEQSYSSFIEDNINTQLDENDQTSDDLAEYLAYTDKPLTLEDVLHVSGRNVQRPSTMTTTERKLHASNAKASLPPSSTTTLKASPRSNLQDQNSSVKFLSTWTTHQSSRPTIHHFCTTDESLLPQLPLPLQLLSRMTHTKSDIITDTSVSRETSKTKDIAIPPNTPPSSPQYNDVIITSSKIDKHGPSTNKPYGLKRSKESSTHHSSAYPSTPKLATHQSSGRNDQDEVIMAAKRRLQREMKLDRPSTSSSLDKRNQSKTTKRMSAFDDSLDVVKSKRSKTRCVRPATTGGRGIRQRGSNVPHDELSVRGDHIAVVKDPSNLLWTPAPPKLSLYPSTIEAHLFPTYHVTQSTVDAPLGRESYLLPGQRSNITDDGDKSIKPRVYNPAIHSVPDFSSLKPLVTTSTSTPSTHSSQTITHSEHGPTDDDTHLTVPSSSVSFTPAKDVQLVPSISTQFDTTDKLSSASTTSSDDVSSIDEGQSIQEQQLSRLLPSLSSRRHTVYVSESSRIGMISSGGLTITEELAEDESSTVDGDDGGTDAQEDMEPIQEVEQQSAWVLSTQSLPLLPSATKERGECHVKLSEEFNSVMNEIKWQRETLVVYHKEQEELLKQQQQQQEEDISEEDELQTDEPVPLEGSMLATSGAFTSRRLQRQAMRGTRKPGSTLGRVKAIRRSRSAQMRAQKAREQISQPPRELKRSVSFPLLARCEDITVQHQPSVDYRKSKRLSQPCLNEENFISLMTSQGAQSDEDHYKWAYDIWWEKWFPEVLKECREAVAGFYSRGSTAIQRSSRHLQTQSSEDARDKDDIGKDGDDDPRADEEMKVISLVNISPVPSLTSQQIEEYESKVTDLSGDINSCRDDGMMALFLCRRGALMRKLGKLLDSMDDLNRAISLLPFLSDAYWHRHLLHLITGDTSLALNDLNALLKLCKKHYGAYRSRAMLHTHGHFQYPYQGVVGGTLTTKDGDIAKAIFDLSQAITIEASAETYFMRGELHEIRGEVESAISDYARVTELEPSNLEAINRQAMHKFKKGMFAASTKHFDMLLKQDPNNTGARIYRAKAQYNMDCYVEALQDLSAAIHLDPNNAQAFYHRACLLRSKQPQQALRDFSVSLLLDDSKDNVSSFIHRGVLYTQMKSYEEALCDFEAAIKLQRTLPSPHVCAGLIHMFHFKNIPRAIRFFSGALAVDPTFVRAYLCRAEAYKRDEKYSKAILDYTKAIHFEPNNPRYFLLKGELYLHLAQYNLASLHIKIASKLSNGLERSRTQKALVESFLGNHEEAINLLKGQLKTPDICTLLGRVQMKAELFGEAADSFKQAAALVDRTRQPSYLVAKLSELDKPGKDSVTAKAQSNIHFLCGRSLVENMEFKEAVDEFSSVLEIEPNHEMAYYERGIAKLKAGNSKGVLDLNKALALNPLLHQAFLARAAYYGKNGRYSKAILNCNEALRLEPNSVRAYLCRGSLKYHTKLYSGAIDDFTMAISMDPVHSSLGHFNRALCYQAIGNLDKALSDYSVVLLLKNSPKFKVLVNRGLLYLQLKDHTNALFDFTQAGTLVRDDPNILQAIGHCYHQLGSLDSAIDAYTEAIQLEPTFVGAYVSRGNAFMDYLTTESFNDSKADYQYSLQLDPHCLPAKINLAFLYQAEGKFQQAWNELTSALREEPHCVAALEARAVISLQMGNLFGALLDINAAINTSRSATLLTNRGVVHQYMGDVVSAMKDYEEAVKLDHTYFLAHFNAGNVHFQQRHFKQAITSYTRALPPSLNPDHSILVNRAIAHVMLHRTQAALEDFNQAIELNPYSAHAHFNRANLYRSLGDYTNAEMDYKKALQLDPDDWLSMYYHGEVLGTLGHMENARQTFERAAQTETKTTCIQ